MQRQVEERIRQLSAIDNKGNNSKIKLQRGGGGAVNVYVKQYVKWPDDYILASNTKDRIAFQQLNIIQWMSGFRRILKEDYCQETREHMLDYVIALLDDANDFSWQSAKASHAILL